MLLVRKDQLRGRGGACDEVGEVPGGENAALKICCAQGGMMARAGVPLGPVPQLVWSHECCSVMGLRQWWDRSLSS